MAGLQNEQRWSRVSMHTENWSLVVSRPLNYLPTSGPMCKTERRMLYIEDRDHSLPLSGDSDRSCSMFGRDFVVGGEDAADGGDAAESVPSRAASGLRTSLVSFFPSTRKLIETLPESICVGLILLVFLFHGRCACPTASSTVFSLRE